MDLDDDFHKQLFHICNKQRIFSLMENMMIHFDRVRSMSLSTVKDIKIVEDHHAILDAIKSRDKVKAKEAIQKHLSRYKIDEESDPALPSRVLQVKIIFMNGKAVFTASGCRKSLICVVGLVAGVGHVCQYMLPKQA